ncbi:hypothetical protein AN395_03511 [Pseudoalteromonas sp. P1-30]|uniref:cellulase family glycosylhydrolase n=1 Tax=Pseudoalteromonas sp. P1-30 TaxID=1723760 RepID=UPI0006D5F839|nr:cellulase family glycosylhydrolase [Pseudoalteromonas sp. P1-30]KPV90050.1 hypothetical protein AN395_03511 [Pseudoalteromonas sp. P1-30]
MRAIFLIIFLMCSTAFASDKSFDNFITVDGTKLMDGDEEFRFLSFNVPTLNYVEDEMAFETANPYALPSEFELHDLFKTVNQLGGRVIRSYTIPVRNNNFPDESITFVESPGVFNEEAFKAMDMAIALAGEYKVRLVVPLLNNWPWMGGRPNYADFRGKKSEDFWTDRQLIEDFKATVNYVLNRTNTITGIKYKDDPTIMAWETGNELENPASWAIEISRYIKSIDDNHLLIDGFNAIHLEKEDVWVQQYSIDEPTIDMVNTHHYEGSPDKMLKNIKKTVEMIGGKKPVFLGEFGFISTTGVEKVLDYVISEPAIPGTFLWSLRRHHPEGGFYQHSEPVGYGLYRAYHWPGFDDGHIYDERNLLKLYREKAFEIQGKVAPKIVVPEAPKLLSFKESPKFSWQGSAGASGYNIQRSPSGKSAWRTIAYNVEDLDTPGFDLYSDTTAEIGKSYYYRVIALNQAGNSEPSNIIGPVEIKYLTQVDKARNFAVLDESRGIELKTGDYRSYKEAFSRLSGKKGSWIKYDVSAPIQKVEVFTYERSQKNALSFEYADSSLIYRPVNAKVSNFSSKEKNYDYLIPKKYTLSRLDFGRIKIIFSDKSEIVRSEIDYIAKD